MAQTAVEWLDRWFRDNPEATHEEGSKALQQAKQMEKEQSKQDYDAGLFDGTMDEVKDRLHKNAEQYYNETYGRPIDDSENNQSI